MKKKVIIGTILELIFIMVICGLAVPPFGWGWFTFLLALICLNLTNYLLGQWSQEKLCDKYHTFRFYEEMYKVHMKGHDDK